MLDRFTGTDQLYATLVNGLHTESIGPASSRASSSSSICTSPSGPDARRAAVVARCSPAVCTARPTRPPAGPVRRHDHDEALAAFEAEPPIRVLFEEGAADGTGRGAAPPVREAFDAWPIPRPSPTEWYLGRRRQLADRAPDRAGELSRASRRRSRDVLRRQLVSDLVGRRRVGLAGRRLGTVAAWATEPLDRDGAMVGSGSVDLYVQSNLGDTDLEVTLTEIRPTARRCTCRAAGCGPAIARSTRRRRPSCGRCTPTSKPTPPLPRRRVRARPGRDLPVRPRLPGRLADPADRRRAGRQPAGLGVRDDRRRRAGRRSAHDPPSKVVLPVVPGIDAPDAYPECGALRGQPCRAYAGDLSTVPNAPGDACDCGRLADGPSRRARRVPAGAPRGESARAGRAAARARAAHARAAARGGGDARRRVGHLVHVARTGAPDQRVPRRAARDRAGAALDEAGIEHLLALDRPRHAGRGAARRRRARSSGCSTRWMPAPAYVLGPHWEFVAWNAAQARLYPRIDELEAPSATCSGCCSPTRRRAS